MKNYLLSCALLFALPAAAQSTSAKSPAGTTEKEATSGFDGANVLLLHTPDSASTALKNFGRLLLRAGYTVDKMDLALGYVTTAEPPRPQLGFSYTYRAIAEPTAGGATLTVTGTYTNITGFMTVVTGPVAFGKGKIGKGFVAIEQVVQAYPNGRVGYAFNPTVGKQTTFHGK